MLMVMTSGSAPMAGGPLFHPLLYDQQQEHGKPNADHITSDADCVAKYLSKELTDQVTTG